MGSCHLPPHAWVFVLLKIGAPHNPVLRSIFFSIHTHFMIYSFQSHDSKIYTSSRVLFVLQINISNYLPKIFTCYLIDIPDLTNTKPRYPIFTHKCETPSVHLKTFIFLMIPPLSVAFSPHPNSYIQFFRKSYFLYL